MVFSPSYQFSIVYTFPARNGSLDLVSPGGVSTKQYFFGRCGERLGSVCDAPLNQALQINVCIDTGERVRV